MEPTNTPQDENDILFKNFVATLGETPSVALPTLRFGLPTTVTIVNRTKVPTNDAQAEIMSQVPDKYVIAHAETKATLALGYAQILSPVSDFSPSPVQQATSSLHPRDAYQMWYSLIPDASAAFFAGQSASAEVTEKLPEVISSIVGAMYLPWLQECCADFFEWLSTPTE